MSKQLRNRWVNETGGDWISSETFTSVADAKEDAKFSFENGTVFRQDTIQCWEVDEDMDISGTCKEAWTAEDLMIEWAD